MTPQDRQLIEIAGHVFLQNHITAICQSALYGIYLVLAITAIRSLFRRGLKTKSTIFLFVALTTVLVTFTIHFLSFSLMTSYMIQNATEDDPSISFQGALVRSDERAEPFKLLSFWITGSTQGFLFWIGDAVLIWRFFVIFPFNRKTGFLLLFLYFSGVGLAIAKFTLVVVDDLRGITKSTTDPGPSRAFTQLASELCFLVLNLITTGMTAKLAYKHRAMIRVTSGQSNSTVSKVMVILAESGLVYCLLLITSTFLIFSPSPLTGPIIQTVMQFATVPTTISGFS